MAGSLILQKALRNATKVAYQNAAMSSYAKSLIGKRDIVGYGYNGEPNYVDRPDFPLPAIRWKESTPDVCALREKEKGDWNQLSVEEKKALYRASFCQTFSEFKAPSGEWKSVVGCSFMIVAGAMWLYYGLKKYVYSPFPVTYDEDRREAQLRRILDLQINPVEGISTLWDYEKDTWKR